MGDTQTLTPEPQEVAVGLRRELDAIPPDSRKVIVGLLRELASKYGIAATLDDNGNLKLCCPTVTAAKEFDAALKRAVAG